VVKGTEQKKPRVWLVLAALVALATVSIPLAYLSVRASDMPVEQVLEVLTRPRVAELAFNTIGLSLAVSVTALGLGTIIAGILTRVRLRFAKTLLLVSALPLAVPSYLASYGWLVLVPSAQGFVPSWAILTAVTVPYVTLPVAAALRGTSAEGEAVARTLGLGPIARFVK
jgi:iron(III) transport system permease protein